MFDTSPEQEIYQATYSEHQWKKMDGFCPAYNDHKKTLNKCKHFLSLLLFSRELLLPSMLCSPFQSKI